ncbi:hypothetical protein [Pseudomonas sp. Irchel 3E13]|uniref:hypothetical protein n=1 Tax=Pseudomonas sp. Irchel 3E13 TaxID=2008975 RepID=UPI000BA39A63|nr:hypothetical protein [Pseudomonas sp. Irchel 3E13]
MSYSNKVLRQIAFTLGNPIGYIGLPWMMALVTVGVTMKQFNNGVVSIPFWVGASLILTFFALPFYSAYTGKRILRAIEKDYGPRTRQAVYDKFAMAKEGELFSLNIPCLAKGVGEGK